MTDENVRSGLRLSRELNQQLRALAKEIGITKNQLMVKILWDWVKRNAS